MKKIKLYNDNLDLQLVNLNEYVKIDLDKQVNFKNDNLDNLKVFNEYLELEKLIENKIDLKNNLEKRKKLVNDNLDNKFLNVLHLQKFIEYLDKNDKRIVNDKKNVNKLWKDLDLQDKSIYENIINYFLLLFMDKNYFLNLDLLNKKVKNEFSKKELKELNELNSFSFKELKSNFLENFNSKYIIENIKAHEWIVKDNSNNLDILKDLLLDKEYNKEYYRFNLKLIKNNIKDLKVFKEYKSKYYKLYQKNENNLNNKIKRKTLKLKEKYNVFYNELLENNVDLNKLKKLVYKKKILINKNELNFKKSIDNYKDFLNDKNIKYLKYLDKNLDIDLDKDKRYNKLKKLVNIKLA